MLHEQKHALKFSFVSTPKVPHSGDSDTPLKSPTQMKYKSTCIK